ncbi:hypothetical protein NL676_025411 [Syzygium grande]|nr:hypothetical protein NL676_025411 [Syzygium grande]
MCGNMSVPFPFGCTKVLGWNYNRPLLQPHLGSPKLFFANNDRWAPAPYTLSDTEQAHVLVMRPPPGCYLGSCPELSGVDASPIAAEDINFTAKSACSGLGSLSNVDPREP